MIKYRTSKINTTISTNTRAPNAMSTSGSGGGGSGCSLIFLNNVFPGEYLRPFQHPPILKLESCGTPFGDVPHHNLQVMNTLSYFDKQNNVIEFSKQLFC